MTGPARSAPATHPAPRGPRAVGRALRVVLVAVALLLGVATSASAHATLERSDPPNGGMVATGRTSLTLWYGEAITTAASTFSLHGDAGDVPLTVAVDEGGRVVHLTSAPLERGTYTLTWAVVAADGHPTRGTVLFGSGFRPDGIPAADSTAPELLPVALRTADLGGTLLALGALLALWRVVPVLGGAAAATARRVLTAGALGATISLAAAVVAPVVTTATQLGGTSSAGAWVSALDDVMLGSSWGRLWLVRLGCLAVAYAALLVARRGAARRRSAPRSLPRSSRVALGALVASVALDSWAGHASALPSGELLVWAAATAHVLAAGAWVGGLLVLAVVLRPLARLERGTRRSVALAGWRAFSPAAAVSSGVLVATGLYEAGRHVDTWNALFRGIYGPSVVAKVLVVATALALAAYNTVVVNDAVAERLGRLAGRGRGWRPRPQPLRTTVLVEASVLALAVVVAAVMTSVPTAREITAAASATAPQSDSADGLFVTVEAVPTGREVRLVVRAQAVIKPLGTPVTGVEVGVVPGTPVAPTTAPADRVQLTQTEPGRYEARVPDPGVPDWTTEVYLHRAGARTTTMLVPWSSAEPRSGFRTATATGALLLLLVVVASLLLARRRRRVRSGGAADRAELVPDEPGVGLLEEAGHR